MDIICNNFIERIKEVYQKPIYNCDELVIPNLIINIGSHFNTLFKLYKDYIYYWNNFQKLKESSAIEIVLQKARINLYNSIKFLQQAIKVYKNY